MLEVVKVMNGNKAKPIWDSVIEKIEHQWLVGK